MLSTDRVHLSPGDIGSVVARLQTQHPNTSIWISLCPISQFLKVCLLMLVLFSFYLQVTYSVLQQKNAPLGVNYYSTPFTLINHGWDGLLRIFPSYNHSQELDTSFPKTSLIIIYFDYFTWISRSTHTHKQPEKHFYTRLYCSYFTAQPAELNLAPGSE